MIGGFGIPAEDLKLESVITGYVLKAQYYLPYSVKQLRTKNVHEISEKGRLLGNATIFDRVVKVSVKGFFCRAPRLDLEISRKTLSILPKRK